MRILDTTSRLRLANLLYATDLSSTAERALPYAMGIARRYGAMLFAAHVIQPELLPLMPPAAWATMAEQEREYRERAPQVLEGQLAGVSHELIFRAGEVWPVISEIIAEKQIDLLILSTHGRKGLQKAILGSAAEEIFRNSPCPVLTVGPDVSPRTARHVGLTRILYATDFSPESLAGAPYAISLAREHRSNLILFHCIEDGAEVSAMLQTLQELIPFGADLRSEPICVAERGSHGEKVLEVAEGHGADMLVLGVPSTKARLAQKSHRSALYRIVTQATCPVLTVRG